MLHNIVMPKLGESVTEGTVVKWLVKPGDSIKQYDNLLEVETAKVVAEVPATEAGIIKEILVKEGDTVAVGAVICVMEITTSSDISSNKNEEADSSNKVKFTEENKEIPKEETIHNNNINDTFKPTIVTSYDANNAMNHSTKNRRYSPVVLSLAEEHNIDLNKIQGTGFENRITRKDILNFIDNSSNISSVSNSNISNSASNSLEKNESTVKNSNMVNSITIDNKTSSLSKSVHKEYDFNVNSTQSTLNNEDKLLPVSAVRKAIAKKMVESVSNIPHAWLTIEVDATNLVNLRNKVKNEFLAKEGLPITYFAFFVVEIVKALQHFPLLNSVWQESNILLKKDINISIAVAVENSLFVPVIKNADSKNIKGIAKEIYELAHKAKNNTLTPSDMQGGTFTINNTGSFGSISSMGIINYPQAAILQVESIVKRPVVLSNNAIAIRDMVNLSLSIDHRIIDGLVAGNFLKAVKHNIENIQ